MDSAGDLSGEFENMNSLVGLCSREHPCKSKWEGLGVEELRGKREIARERKACCTYAGQGILPCPACGHATQLS